MGGAMTENGDRALLLALPLPLAQAWRRALFAETTAETHERALLALEVMLKLLAAGAAAAWVAAGAKGETPRTACRALVRPSLGQWAAILRECAAALPASDAFKHWLDRLRAERIEARVTAFKARTVGEMLEALPAYRNEFAHGASLTSQSAAERAPELLALTREILAFLAAEDAPKLVGVAGSRTVRLTGVGAVIESEPATHATGTVAFQHRGGDLLLSPLWVFDPDDDDVLVLNKGAGLPKVEYLSYGVSHGGTGLTVKRCETASSAARFLETATGRGRLEAGDVAALVEETEVRELAARATERWIGPYRIVRQVAKGGQGILYEAIEEDPPRRVALKLLPLASAVDDAARRRFAEESRALARVEHPGVVPIHATGEHDGVPWIAMRFVEGKNLAEVIRELAGRAGPITMRDWNRATAGPGDETDDETAGTHVERAASIARDVARILQACHDRDVVHRDVKPSNVMLDIEGRVQLTDFGVARTMETRSRTLTHRFVGTLQYLAPEALLPLGKHRPDRRVDVYGLGVTLYELVALRRPFQEYESDERALLHAVQTKEPPMLRRVAPWAPKDLATITAKAMEKDRDRRYQSANELAEDLERFLRKHAIRARPAGVVTRVRKWARRNPARAVAAGAALAFLMAAIGTTIGLRIAAERAVTEYLRGAGRRLEEGDFDSARGLVERAKARDPSSVAAVRLEQRIRERQQAADRAHQVSTAFAAASRARDEAERKKGEYEAARSALAKNSRSIAEMRARVSGQFVARSERAALSRLENEGGILRVQIEKLIRERGAALDRAVRHEATVFDGKAGPETEAAFAAYYYDLYLRALEHEDRFAAERFAASVRAHDVDGRFERDLLGLGTLTVTTTPADAEVRLFRYEPYETVRSEPAVVSRLVPVPTLGRGRVKPGEWLDGVGFFPGDPCLVVTDVVSDSHAGRAGLRPGDLVVRLDDRPCNSRSAAKAVAGKATTAVRLLCLKDGAPRPLAIPEGECSGLRCEVTAYPLILGAENRIEAAEPIDVDPGSYLLVARKTGFEPLRYPTVIARGGRVGVKIVLHESGTTPDGFVYVAPGSFESGGDLEAFDSPAKKTTELPGFFLARKELTYREWFEFVNDGDVQPRIVAARNKGRAIFLPRDPEHPKGFAIRWLGRFIPDESPETPVLGISRADIDAYLAWRNKRAEANHEPWTYDLPTEAQWEKAGRGADGRCFPWGDRFDFSLTVGFHSGPETRESDPGGTEPRDESPFGVLDMAGSRIEWMKNRYGPGSPKFALRGGSWRGQIADTFRLTDRLGMSPTQVLNVFGLRLVARPR
jgi:serine/threonine protein kinase/formylglycine-generating enzyme required for sulfatase activity